MNNAAYMLGYRAGERVTKIALTKMADAALGIGFCLGCLVGAVVVVVFGPLVFRWLA